MDAKSPSGSHVEFRPLPAEMAKNADFPIGCTVLHQQAGNAQGAETKFLLGIVEEVGVSFAQDKGVCYKVRQTSGIRHLLCGNDLQFAPRAPVFLSLGAGDETYQRDAIILQSEHEPNCISSSLRYTVRVKDSKKSYPATIFSNVSPKDLAYRTKDGKPKSTPPSAYPPPATCGKKPPAKTGHSSEQDKGAKAVTERQRPVVTPTLTHGHLTQAPMVTPKSRRYPFQNIWQEGQHQYSKAVQELVRLSGTYPDLPNPFCFNYHLKGYCNKGDRCSRAKNHKHLSPTEARKIELILAPVTSSKGPIYSPPTLPARTITNPQSSPFKRILVGSKHRFSEAIRQISHTGDPLVCLAFHLKGLCQKGPQCPFNGTHRDLTTGEARTIEHAFAPVMGSNGPIYIKSPANDNYKDVGKTKKRRSDGASSQFSDQSNLKRPRYSNSVSISPAMKIHPKVLQWTPPPPPPPPPQPSNTPKLESAEPKTKTTTIHCKVPPSFGYSFFHRVILGSNGEVAQALGQKYSCSISLPVRKLGDGSDRSVISVAMAGKHEKCLLDCGLDLEVLMVNAVERDLRAFLFFRLAVLNSMYSTDDLHIKRVPTSCGLDFDVDTTMKYMAFVNPGGKNDSNNRQVSLNQAKNKLQALRFAHPQCCVELFVHSRNFPAIRPFLFIGGPRFHLVQECYQDVKSQCCG